MPTVDVRSDDDSAPEAATAAPSNESTTTPAAAPAAASKKAMPKVPAALVAIAILAIAVVLLGLYAWQLRSDKGNLTTELTAVKANPQKAVQDQTNQLIGNVGKLINLPKGETPTVAAVTDAAAAKKQSAFFNDAQNGDKVLLYVKAGEAILYRPSTNKIILVAPLTFSNTSGTTPSTTTTKH